VWGVPGSVGFLPLRGGVPRLRRSRGDAKPLSDLPFLQYSGNREKGLRGAGWQTRVLPGDLPHGPMWARALGLRSPGSPAPGCFPFLLSSTSARPSESYAVILSGPYTRGAAWMPTM
jgi:hypothetical protein